MLARLFDQVVPAPAGGRFRNSILEFIKLPVLNPLDDDDDLFRPVEMRRQSQ
ncbi:MULTISPECIES: hypothetical protein [Rhizobium]|uniref:hypothetical protein n=1 Tax=Rhizobium TaxID=379 RepID=UPI00130081AB|nr:MULTISPECIES: hypothetical protein [Rhizobium]MCS0463392.1 hypothetical protein [Rhizobium favelukesii]UFS85072.1 hypothetical protein LPB79_32180 [Rhizobium sp. T136]